MSSLLTTKPQTKLKARGNEFLVWKLNYCRHDGEKIYCNILKRPTRVLHSHTQQKYSAGLLLVFIIQNMLTFSICKNQLQKFHKKCRGTAYEAPKIQGMKMIGRRLSQHSNYWNHIIK